MPALSGPRVRMLASLVALGLLAALRGAAAHTTQICLGQDPNTTRVAFWVAHWHAAMPASGFLRVRKPLANGTWPPLHSALDQFTDYKFGRSVQNGQVVAPSLGVADPGGLTAAKLISMGYTCIDFNGGGAHQNMFWDFASFSCCPGENLYLYAEFPGDFQVLEMREPGGLFVCPAEGIGAALPAGGVGECNTIKSYTTGQVEGIPASLLPNVTGVPGAGCPTTCNASLQNSYVDTFDVMVGGDITIYRNWTSVNPCDNTTLIGVQLIEAEWCDVDECVNGTDTCSANSTCVNVVGPAPSFNCTCDYGFSGDNCDNPNECLLGTANCHPNATCYDTATSFQCVCNAGFQGNGTTCEDVDECALDRAAQAAGASNGAQAFERFCAPRAVCTNTVGGYKCVCPKGFAGNGTTCDGVCPYGYTMLGSGASAECCAVLNNVQPISFEHAEARCNALGAGVHLLSVHASNAADVDTLHAAAGRPHAWIGGEDRAVPNTFRWVDNTTWDFTRWAPGAPLDAPAAADCVHLSASTPSEWQVAECGDNVMCAANEPITQYVCCGDEQPDLCAIHNPCQNGGVCRNTFGCRTCNCTGTGFNGTMCEQDIDECAAAHAASLCPAGQVCMNLPGSYRCTGIDACAAGGAALCHAHATCTSGNGTFACHCNAGYVGTGAYCALNVTIVPAPLPGAPHNNRLRWLVSFSRPVATPTPGMFITTPSNGVSLAGVQVVRISDTQYYVIADTNSLASGSVSLSLPANATAPANGAAGPSTQAFSPANNAIVTTPITPVMNDGTDIAGNSAKTPSSASRTYEVLIDFRHAPVTGVAASNFRVQAGGPRLTFTVTPYNGSAPTRFWRLRVDVASDADGGEMKIHIHNDAQNIQPLFAPRAAPVFLVDYGGKRGNFSWLLMLAICSAVVALCVCCGVLYAKRRHDKETGKEKRARDDDQQQLLGRNGARVAPTPFSEEQRPAEPVRAGEAKAASGPAPNFTVQSRSRRQRLPPMQQK